MALTRGQTFLKMINDITQCKPKHKQEEFRKAEILRVIQKAEYFQLSEEDVLELKQAIQTTSREEQQQSSSKAENREIPKGYFLGMTDERLDWDRINRLIQELTDKEAAEAKK